MYIKENIFVPHNPERSNIKMMTLRLIIAAASAVLPGYFFFEMISADSRAQVILNGVCLLPVLYLFGLVTTLLFSGPASWTLVDFLLYPRRLLKKAPPILSRQQGLIARKCYAEAETELLELRETHKSIPEVALMLAELHAVGFNDPEKAIADCLFYFKYRSLRYNKLNLPLLLRYADWMEEQGLREEALARLTREAESPFYPSGEKKALRARAESLRQQSSEK